MAVFKLPVVVFVLLFASGAEWALPGVTLTPERMMAPIILLIILLLLASNRKIDRKSSAFVLFAMIVAGLASSLLGPVPSWAFRGWIVLIFAISFYYFFVLLKTDPKVIFTSKLVYWLSWLFGPVSAFIYVVTVFLGVDSVVGGYWLVDGSGGIRIKAFTPEPNIFACMAAILTLMMIARAGVRGRVWWVLMIGLNLSILFSFSRIPWLAYIVGLAAYFLILRPKPISTKNILKFIFWSVLVLGVGYLVWTSVSDYFASNEILSREYSIDARFVMWNLAAQGFFDSPWLGNGLFSFSELHPEAPALVGSDTYRSAWISNLFLAFAHDGGVLLLGLMFWYFGSVLIRSWRIIRKKVLSDKPVSSLDVRVSAALFASGVLLLISGQSIPAHSLGFFWAIFALLENSMNPKISPVSWATFSVRS